MGQYAAQSFAFRHARADLHHRLPPEPAPEAAARAPVPLAIAVPTGLLAVVLALPALVLLALGHLAYRATAPTPSAGIEPDLVDPYRSTREL